MSELKIDIAELSRKVQNVFPMPQILAKILEAVNNPQASAASLERVFKHEPSFTLKLLTLANSSYYGSPGTVTNIRAAITLLGLNLIKSLAVHASVNELFRFGSATPIFSGYELWKHSVGVGICAKMISRRLKLGNAEDFFTMGILHDIGLIIEYQFFRDAFLEILASLQEKQQNLVDAERDVLGMDHANLTRVLCDKWNLPDHLSAVVQYHHQPLLAPEPVRAAACCIAMANHLVRQARFGFTYPGASEPDLAVGQLLGLEPVDLAVLREDFEQEVLELSIFFD